MKNKNLSFLGDINREDEILLSKINQWADEAEDKYTEKYSFFFDMRQLDICEKLLKSIRFENYKVFGGYGDSGRCILCVFSSYLEIAEDNFPIVPVEFIYRNSDVLTHRDFLGAILAQGIERQTVGDIIVSQGKAIVFLYETVADFIMQNISKIGRVGVKTSVGYDENIVPKQDFLEISGTVASLRLDCIVGLALRLSRAKVLDLIKSVGVDVNFNTVYNAGFCLSKGDEFSVRGHGKYRLSEINGVSKKERVHISVQKYI